MAGNTYYSSYETAAPVLAPSGVRSSSVYVPEGALMKHGALRSRAAVEDAARRGTTVEAMCVLCDCTTMQLTVELPDGIRGILPREEAGWVPHGELKDIAIITRVGKPIQFKITELYETDRGEMIALLSRRAAQQECYERYISRLVPGDVIPARVTHLEPFGAFCDIGGGFVSLLTVDRISVSRISHPSDRFRSVHDELHASSMSRSGDFLHVAVQTVEDDGRIYLTHRELLGTWEENAAAFSPGQTVPGIIRSVEDYGIFVELAPNLAGLAESFPGARPGDACSVYIKSLLPDRMKIKLVLIDLCGKSSPSPCRYFLSSDSARHLSHWRYSPVCCPKVVETVFTGEG